MFPCAWELDAQALRWRGCCLASASSRETESLQIAALLVHLQVAATALSPLEQRLNTRTSRRGEVKRVE